MNKFQIILHCPDATLMYDFMKILAEYRKNDRGQTEIEVVTIPISLARTNIVQTLAEDYRISEARRKDNEELAKLRNAMEVIGGYVKDQK